MLLVAACGFHLAHSRLALVMLSLAFAAPLLLFKEMFRRVCFAHLEVGTALVVDFAVGLLTGRSVVDPCRPRLLSAPMGNLAIGVACMCSPPAGSCVIAVGLSLAFETRRVLFGRNWALGRWIFGSQLLWACSLYSYPWSSQTCMGWQRLACGLYALASPHWETHSCWASKIMSNPGFPMHSREAVLGKCEGSSGKRRAYWAAQCCYFRLDLCRWE